MFGLLEELKNNFEVIQLDKNKESFRVKTEWYDTIDKAINGMIKLLKEEGHTKLILPYLPVPYIINDRDGNYQGVVSLCKE